MLPSFRIMNTNNSGARSPIKSALGLPVPPTIVAFETNARKAERQGRKDHRIIPNLDDGLTPWTASLHESVREKTHLISEELHDSCAKLDAAVAAAIQRFARLDGTEIQAPSAIVDNASELAKVRGKIAGRQHSASVANRQRDLISLREQVASTVTERRHLHEQARDAVNQLSAAFGSVAASHRRGQLHGPLWRFWVRGRGFHRDVHTAPLPTFRPTALPWYEHDLPFMDTNVSAHIDGFLEWDYRDFNLASMPTEQGDPEATSPHLRTV